MDLLIEIKKRPVALNYPRWRRLAWTFGQLDGSWRAKAAFIDKF
jgi:hypothetical protein